MTEGRRGSGDKAGTRKAILDATEKLMREEGYAAVSSRRVAEIAGLRSQLVHYHFGTMDNLFLALFRRAEEDYLARQVRSLTSTTPLRSLWEQSLKQSDTRLTIEFIALALHHEAIREELAQANDRTRRLHAMVIADALERGGPGPTPAAPNSPGAPPPEVLAFLIAAVSRTLVTERALGAEAAHPAVLDYVEACLAAAGSPPKRRGG